MNRILSGRNSYTSTGVLNFEDMCIPSTHPSLPDPATVSTVPSATLIRRTLLLPRSATYTSGLLALVPSTWIPRISLNRAPDTDPSYAPLVPLPATDLTLPLIALTQYTFRSELVM